VIERRNCEEVFWRNGSTKHLRMGIEFWDLSYYIQNCSTGCIVFAVSCFDWVMIILYLLQNLDNFFEFVWLWTGVATSDATTVNISFSALNCTQPPVQVTGLPTIWIQHGDLKFFIMTHQHSEATNHFIMKITANEKRYKRPIANVSITWPWFSLIRLFITSAFRVPRNHFP